MKKFKPYVSIDLETTGLSHDSDILEIAAIFDDGGPIDQLRKFHSIIKYDKFKYAEMFAINMNDKLIEEILKGRSDKPYSALTAFENWLLGIRESLPKQENGELPRLTVAGKNAAGFDVPILAKNYQHYAGTTLGKHNITENFSHRTLDVGSMYFPDFGENVNLSKINELTGRTQVSHRAMDDAMDVVFAIRHKMLDEQEKEK